MASSGNEIERWAHRQGGRTGQLVEPVAPPENGHRLWPGKSMGSVDRPRACPGRADSAHSSCSGGSNVPEHRPAPCRGECCCLPPEQAPYMDLEYVRGISNLGAAPCAPGSLRPAEAPGLGILGTPGLGILGTPATSKQGPPPSPPARLEGYGPTRPLESRRAGGGAQPAAGGRDGQRAPGEAPRRQRWGQPPERGTRPAKETALESKGLLSPDSTKEVSVSKVQGLKREENGERSPSQQPAKRSNPHVSSRPSSFIFQEYLKTDSVANVPKILSAYNSIHTNKIPKETNTKFYHPANSNPKAVHDTREVRQCPCGVQQPNVREAALQSTVPGPSQRKGSWPCAQDLLCAEWHPDMEQDAFEDTRDLKYMENALLIKNASRKLNSCTDEKQCCDSEGKTGRAVREPVLNQPGRVQRSSLPCSCAAAETEQGGRRCCDNMSQAAFLRPREDSTSQLCEVQKRKQADNSSPDLGGTCLEQGEPPAEKHQPEFQTQPSRQLREGCAGDQITRQMTPMLYYLSGGTPPSIPDPNKLTPSQEDSRSSAKEMPLGSCAASARCSEMQRERQQRSSPLHRGSADGLLLHTQDLSPGGPASATDESFTNDYREKLKVAQKKVLRETSFKRKDLQMSLPVRLRQKPSRRPSIEHLRSFSLSSASEGAKPVPCSPSHLESLESFNRNEEIRGPPTGRVGGRKRVTQEEKELCYSEPEKLDQLMDKEIWSQVRDEITEQDTVGARRRALENGGRALSSSSISRTELKQIQHTALVEYVERKTSQRPGGSQPLPLQKPPLQKRLSHPKGSPGKISNPSGSRKIEDEEVFCQVFSKEKSPDAVPALAFVPPRSVSSRGGPSEAHGSCTRTCPSAGSLPQAGDAASGRAQGRSKSPPPSTQDTCRCASGAAAPSQGRGSCASTPSFHNPERDGCKNHEHNALTRRQDTEELAPEPSATFPRGGSREGAGVEEECRTPSVSGNAALKQPEQLPAASAEQGRSLHTALAQPPHGDKNPAQGFIAQEDVPQGRGTLLPRRRLQAPQDLRHQELAMEIIAKDSSLVDILVPHPDRKTALDLMEGLFPVSVSLLDKSHRKKGEVQQVQEKEKSPGEGAAECPESEHEAKQRSRDPTSKENQVLNRSRDSTNDLDDITSKKLELAGSLRGRLRGLWEQRELVLSEAKECAERGQELEATVRELCKPNEFRRYLMFIGDLEKVVSLLLCLSSRLARVQNALSRLEGSADTEEKQSLSERHQLLSRQREDAKDLKENLDRRERVVSGILAKYLTEQQLQDYQHFVQAKTSLLIEQKDLEEQIKFFEEQLESLEQSIPL